MNNTVGSFQRWCLDISSDGGKLAELLMNPKKRTLFLERLAMLSLEYGPYDDAFKQQSDRLISWFAKFNRELEGNKAVREKDVTNLDVIGECLGQINYYAGKIHQNSYLSEQALLEAPERASKGVEEKAKRYTQPKQNQSNRRGKSRHYRR